MKIKVNTFVNTEVSPLGIGMKCEDMWNNVGQEQDTHADCVSFIKNKINNGKCDDGNGYFVVEDMLYEYKCHCCKEIITEPLENCDEVDHNEPDNFKIYKLIESCTFNAKAAF